MSLSSQNASVSIYCSPDFFRSPPKKQTSSAEEKSILELIQEQSKKISHLTRQISFQQADSAEEKEIIKQVQEQNEKISQLTDSVSFQKKAFENWHKTAEIFKVMRFRSNTI